MRIASESGVPLSLLLHALRRGVEQSSSRAVAEEVGITHRGLGMILKGSRLQARTLVKVEAWYVLRGSGEQRSARIAEAFELLLDAIPEDQRRGAIQRVRSLLRKLHDEMGVPIPPELAEEDE